MNAIVRFDDIEIKDREQEKFNVRVIMLKGEKGDPGVPTDTQVQNAVNTWLTAHPEATTTVLDGSITDAKFASDTKITNSQIDSLFS